MGMAVGAAKGIKNEINVTPLVDVVLVLLIIFMVDHADVPSGGGTSTCRRRERSPRTSRRAIRWSSP